MKQSSPSWHNTVPDETIQYFPVLKPHANLYKKKQNCYFFLSDRHLLKLLVCMVDGLQCLLCCVYCELYVALCCAYCAVCIEQCVLREVCVFCDYVQFMLSIDRCSVWCGV